MGGQKDGVIFEVHRSVTNGAALPEGFLPLDGRQTVQTVYGSFTALDVTTHACAMLLHMLCHFVSSGFGLRQLYDWAFWMKNMPVDAQKVHAPACAVGAERFLYAVTHVCADSGGHPPWRQLGHERRRSDIQPGIYGDRRARSAGPGRADRRETGSAGGRALSVDAPPSGGTRAAMGAGLRTV